MLEARGLEKNYKGRRVVRSVDLSVRAGEVVGLLGPNGAGKTTTFYMMVGMSAPDRGEIYLGGEPITRLPMYLRARRGIGYLPQESSVFRGMTVEENILAVLEMQNLPDAERTTRLRTLLEEFHLAHLARHGAATLSGGERRRLEMARALVLSPRFLLLDEPFAGVDPILVTEIQGMIFRLKQKGIGVLMTDHNVQETLRITDRAYIIHEGEILMSGTPPEIVNHPRARAVYLGNGGHAAGARVGEENGVA